MQFQFAIFFLGVPSITLVFFGRLGLVLAAHLSCIIPDFFIPEVETKRGGALVKTFGGEFPDRYVDKVMRYLEVDPDYFRADLADRFRSPKLWIKDHFDGKLPQPVLSYGFDDPEQRYLYQFIANH